MEPGRQAGRACGARLCRDRHWVRPDMHAQCHMSTGRGFLPRESFVLEKRDKNRTEIKTGISRKGTY